MKIFIYAPAFSWGSGGRIALHKLADVLFELGEDVVLVTEKAGEDKPYPVVFCVWGKPAEGVEVSKNDWVLYPEKLDGNPMGAINVVRWFLNVPGHRGGTADYGHQDLIFHYSPNFQHADYQSHGLLRVADYGLDSFYSYRKKRLGISMIIRKSRSYRRSHFLEKLGVPVADFLGELSRNQVNQFFNSMAIFVSYDTESYYSVQAALSGALSIVVPRIERKRVDFYNHGALRYGVAYGVRGIPWALMTRGKLRGYLQQKELEDQQTVVDFVSVLKSKRN